MFVVGAALAIVQGVGMYFLPMSPRYLIIKGQLQKVTIITIVVVVTSILVVVIIIQAIIMIIQRDYSSLFVN